MSVARHRLLALFLSAACAARSGSAAPPDEPKPKQLDVTIADLGWFAGDWRHVEQGALSQEVWTQPQGDCLLGMWRLVDAAGTSRVFELLSICQESTGPTLRLRHFDRRFHAREEKDAPLLLTLTSALQNRATFEGEEGPLRVRLSYQRDGDQLVATLIKGEQPAQEYRFHRAAP